MNFSVRHGRTLDEARVEVERAVRETCSRFPMMVRRVEWSQDRNSATIFGTGFEADVRVDLQEAHLSCDVPLLGGLLGGPVIEGLKQIIQRTFHKQLPVK